MKAYKLEILVINHEDMSLENILIELSHSHHINPQVQSVSETDIGPWHDDHPLNKKLTCNEMFKQLDWKEVKI